MSTTEDRPIRTAPTMTSYVNGAPASVEQLQALSLSNFGHYTSMRIEGGRAKGLGIHLGRLRRDCRLVFGTQLDTEKVVEYMRQAVAGRAGDLALRVTVFDPALGLIRVAGETDPHVMVTVREARSGPWPPLSAKSFRFVRDTAEVKHIGLFSQFHYRRQATLAGFDDAIFVERDARLSEGATWNLGFVARNGDLLWPDAPVLPGVTMQLLQRALPKMQTLPISLGNLGEMRAAFATNAGFGVRPISRIDGFDYPPDDPGITAVQEAYDALPGQSL